MLGRTTEGHYSIQRQGYPVANSRPINDEMAQRAAKALDEIWAADNATLEEISQGTILAGYLFRASTNKGQDLLAKSLLKIMASNRTAIGMINRKSCTTIGWNNVANHSSHFPENCLPELTELLIHRLTVLPLRTAWAQSRIAMEILLRSEKLEEQNLAYSALLAIRTRTMEQPIEGAQAFAACVIRITEEKNWPSKLDASLEIIALWAEDASRVTDPEVREVVALNCRKLALMITGPFKKRLCETLEMLRNDVRMRVRIAASEPLPENGINHK